MMEAPTAAVPKAAASTQIERFVAVGISTVCLDYLVLYLLTSEMRVNYLASAAVAFMLASTVNYALSIRFVFFSGRFSKGVEFGFFLATSLAGLGLNQAVMWVLVELCGVHYLIAKAASIALVTVWNFVSKKRLVFLG